MEQIKKVIKETKEPWYEVIWGGLYYFFNYKIKDFYFNLKYYFKNLYRFHKSGIIWNFREFDHIFCEELYVFGLKELRDSIKNDSNEIKECASKKAEAIDRLINELDSDWKPQFDSSKSFKENFHIYKEAENKHYETIFKLIRGQQLPYNDPKFDGSGATGWWW